VIEAHDIAAFEAERRRLAGLAYRMLGSLAEADDVLQDAWIRWQNANRAEIESPAAFLTRVVTRLCLDRMKAAKASRETYVGPWLPEPVADDDSVDSGTGSDLAADLSVALLLALERLSPLERAAFLLHDVFDLDYAEVARTLERSEDACRQLAARARSNVQQARTRFPVSREKGEQIAAAFLTASREGDTDQLLRLLAADAQLRTDGGGLRRAALNPILGAERIARFYAGIARKHPADQPADRPSGKPSARPTPTARLLLLNGLPGYISFDAEGCLQTTTLELDGDRIVAIYVVRNPTKLRGVAAWA
jgi:RNA polymerase sigma-70 factor (ECF subfamily)